MTTLPMALAYVPNQYWGHWVSSIEAAQVGFWQHSVGQCCKLQYILGSLPQITGLNSMASGLQGCLTNLPSVWWICLSLFRCGVECRSNFVMVVVLGLGPFPRASAESDLCQVLPETPSPSVFTVSLLFPISPAELDTYLSESIANDFLSSWGGEWRKLFCSWIFLFHFLTQCNPGQYGSH